MSRSCEATVVIPQRNRGEMTLGCVQSLRRFDGETWSILVVDDGSDDDSVELIRQSNVANCRVIDREGRGVTAAWNVGVCESTTRFVVLLNNDVVIEGPFMDALLAPLRESRGAITGVEWRVEPFFPRRMSSRFPDRRLLAGWCWAFEKELWTRLSGFDEELRLYFSDTDFQCRAVRRELSECCPMNVVPGLPLRHLGHQTTRRDPQRSAKWRADRDCFLAKWNDSNASAKRR